LLFWQDIKTSNTHSLAIKSDGSMWTWGSLFLETAPDTSSPVIVGTTNSWSQVSSGAAIRSNGTLWTWGANDFASVGNLGLNDRIHRSSPTQVGTSSWSQVSTNGHYTMAIRSNGTLWAWGRNDLGQLGTNSRIHRSSPVQIGTSSWLQVSVSIYPDTVDFHLGHVLAIRSDGLLFAWGYGQYGQLGTNDNDPPIIHYRSSPTLVGSITNPTWTNTSIPNSILGAASLTASTTPNGNNDDGYWAINIPWNYVFNGTTYTSAVTQVNVGTNQYLTFGTGSTAFSSLTASNPAINKIMYASGDRSVQRIYHGIEGTAPNRTYRIRSEGSAGTSGTLGSPTEVFEFTFCNCHSLYFGCVSPFAIV
jgi:alpha-tubulin suppressor-like RCC1 family protein